MRTLSLAAIALSSALVASSPALAQPYPAKPVRIIITYAGGAEAIGRVITQKMTESMGQPVLLYAQVGANGSAGALAASRAAPDGYTLLSSTGATQVIRKFLVKDVPYDPIRDFTPITQVFDAVATVVGRPELPPTFLQVLEQAKKNPGKLSYGSSGIGSAYNLAGELIHRAAKRGPGMYKRPPACSVTQSRSKAPQSGGNSSTSGSISTTTSYQNSASRVAGNSSNGRVPPAPRPTSRDCNQSELTSAPSRGNHRSSN